MKRESTFWVRIYLSGPVDVISQLLREECRREGLCVTVESTLFLYTGGEERGVVVQLINYPRFPSTREQLWSRAVAVALRLRDGTYQDSVLVMSPEMTEWHSVREADNVE